MAARYEAPQGGLSPDLILSRSKITRVARPDGKVSIVIIHDGGKLTLKQPDGLPVTFRDEWHRRQVSIETPEKETVVVRATDPYQPSQKIPVPDLGTIQYIGENSSY